MLELIALVTLVTFVIFIVGVLIGVRCQEINMRGRERRLALERRRVNEQTRAYNTYWEVGNLF